jgi:hypothetical protein
MRLSIVAKEAKGTHAALCWILDHLYSKFDEASNLKQGIAKKKVILVVHYCR